MVGKQGHKQMQSYAVQYQLLCTNHPSAGLYQNLVSPGAVLDQQTDTAAVQQLQLAPSHIPRSDLSFLATKEILRTKVRVAG
jgi:hypothetical protein